MLGEKGLDSAVDADALRQRQEEFLRGQQLYYAAVKAQNEELDRFRKSLSEHRQAIELLEDLPAKTRHEIMVPIGTKAFMPGHLVHTNEVLVLLGDNYFAERSAQQTTGILQRRVQVIEDLTAKGDSRTKDLLARADLSEQARSALQASMAGGKGQGGGKQGKGSAASAKKPVAAAARPAAAMKPPAQPAAAQPKRIPVREDEDDEDDDIGQGPEFWQAAGFVGGWANDEREDSEEEDEEGGEEHAGAERAEDNSVWDDSEPVFEIRETEEGGTGEVVKHASQIAFEQSGSYPYGKS